MSLAAQRAGKPAALAAINVAAVIFGTTALFGKLNVSPIWIVAGRAVFAALTLFALGIARRTPFRAAIPELAAIAATGVLLALHWVTFFMSVQQAGVAVATLTFATFPLITILIESAVHRRAPKPIDAGAGGVIVIAVLLLVGRGLPDAALAEEGAFVGLLSAACFAAFSVGSQRLGRHRNAITLSFYQNVAVAMLLAFAAPFASPVPHGIDWAVISALGVVATALMHQLYFFALGRLPASVCGGFVALEPVYAIIFAAVLFGEPIVPMVVVSGGLIVGASILLLSHAPAVPPQ